MQKKLLKTFGRESVVISHIPKQLKAYHLLKGPLTKCDRANFMYAYSGIFMFFKGIPESAIMRTYDLMINIYVHIFSNIDIYIWYNEK